LQSFFKN